MSRTSPPSAPEPILASWKISDVLREYPALLDELIALDPAFAPLRNPLRRRVQARLVTVAQAARIAGMEPAALARRLNTAIDAPPADDDSAPDAPARSEAAPAWLANAQVAATFDARPLLQRGEEPFSAIMRAASEVPKGQVFRLDAPFDPLPLYDALAKRGFQGWGRQAGPDHWEVFFLNEGRPSEPSPPAIATVNPPPLDWDAPESTVTIDVSDLVPPEPLVKILEAVADLPAGGRLLVHHVRRPIHLYPRLDDLGCRHETREPEPGRVELLIQKPAATTETGS